MNAKHWLPVLLCCVGMQATSGVAEDRFAAAVAHYRAGRYEEARVAFAAELSVRGDEAPAALRTNLALAALRVQRTSDAEEAARPLLGSRELEDRAFGEFLLGQAAFQRGERAAAAARLPDAEPMAWDSALRSMHVAAASWCRAAELRSGWPEALRNAERAQRRLAELKQLRDAAAPTPPKRTEPEPRPEPPERPAGQAPEEVQPELVHAALSAAGMADLLRRLQAKEREKRSARQLLQRGAAVAGERDW